MAETELGLAIAAIIAAIATGIIQRVRPAGLKILFDFKDEILQRVTILEGTHKLLLKVIEDKLIDAFHSPHTPEIDRLLEKWKANTIEQNEMCDLKHKIEDELKRIDPKSPIYIAGALLVASLEIKTHDW